MKNILSIFVLASLLFTSCKKEETTEETPVEEVATDANAIATTDSLATTDVPSTPQTDANTTNSVMNGQPITGSTSTPPPTQKAAKGMNPAHGQPGHRCDISVGEPLNSPPGKAKTPSIPTQAIKQSTTVTPEMLKSNTTATPTTPAAPVVTAPGMNPPHGQEGHVCGTAVGAPLPK